MTQGKKITRHLSADSVCIVIYCYSGFHRSGAGGRYYDRMLRRCNDLRCMLSGEGMH